MSVQRHVINLKDKIALISGASSGIGAATAVLFSKLGARVSITGKEKEDLENIHKQCSNCFSYCCDLTDEDQVKCLVDSTISNFGGLDILVNSSGILRSGTIETTSLKQFDEVFNVNVRSMYYLTMLCVPHLIRSKGNIVNVSSVNGLRSFPGILAYGMSKSAIDQFTRSTALELAPKHVRVNSVNPGVIETGIHLRGGMDESDYKKYLDHCKTTHALGRIGQSDEVANAIAFLASDLASFITGVQLPVDGGKHVMSPR